MSDPQARHIVISSDGHAGADLLDYRPYLAADLHDEFDAWAAEFHDPWADFDLDMDAHEDDGFKMGRMSFVSSYSWDSDARLRHMDAEGIAAEVLYPNTVPPFYPSGAVTAPAPRTPEEHRRRWAGVQAHNRWLADFCALAPERRIGLCQVFLEDVDAAIAEVRWAREAGLRGVLLPPDHPLKLVPIYERRLDPLWAACCELDLPVHRHAASVGDDEAVFGPGAPAIAAHENEFYFARALPQVVFSGVLERHPTLRFVFAEAGITWAATELRKIDAELVFGRQKGHGGYPVFHRAAAELSMTASEYWARNCWIAASLMRPNEVAVLPEVGIDKVMWGADYPHTEGTFPHATLSMRLLLGHLAEDEVDKVLFANAASIYGVDRGALRALADRIGPTVAEVARPVEDEELPERTMSTTVGAAIDALAGMARQA